MASELWVCIGIWSSERREQERSCVEALEQKGFVRRERRYPVTRLLDWSWKVQLKGSGLSYIHQSPIRLLKIYYLVGCGNR